MTGDSICNSCYVYICWYITFPAYHKCWNQNLRSYIGPILGRILIFWWNLLFSGDLFINRFSFQANPKIMKHIFKTHLHFLFFNVFFFNNLILGHCTKGVKFHLGSTHLFPASRWKDFKLRLIYRNPPEAWSLSKFIKSKKKT